jgi:hypothetical protein
MDSDGKLDKVCSGSTVIARTAARRLGRVVIVDAVEVKGKLVHGPPDLFAVFAKVPYTVWLSI